MDSLYIMIFDLLVEVVGKKKKKFVQGRTIPGRVNVYCIFVTKGVFF